MSGRGVHATARQPFPMPAEGIATLAQVPFGISNLSETSAAADSVAEALIGAIKLHLHGTKATRTSTKSALASGQVVEYENKPQNRFEPGTN